jgi:hypothetical protein
VWPSLKPGLPFLFSSSVPPPRPPPHPRPLQPPPQPPTPTPTPTHINICPSNHIYSFDFAHVSVQRMVGTTTKTNKHVDGVIVSRNQSRAALFLSLYFLTVPPGITLFLTLISPIAAPGDGDRYRDEEDQDPPSRPQEQGAGINAQTRFQTCFPHKLGHSITNSHTHTHLHTHSYSRTLSLLHIHTLAYSHTLNYTCTRSRCVVVMSLPSPGPGLSASPHLQPIISLEGTRRFPDQSRNAAGNPHHVCVFYHYFLSLFLSFPCVFIQS